MVWLVVLLVAASALYPARMAGRICTPGIERRWTLPPPLLTPVRSSGGFFFFLFGYFFFYRKFI